MKWKLLAILAAALCLSCAPKGYHVVLVPDQPEGVPQCTSEPSEFDVRGATCSCVDLHYTDGAFTWVSRRECKEE